MSKVELIYFPDERLKVPSQVVTEFNSELHALLDEMAVIMRSNDGRGLAAPQVGVNKRVFIAFSYSGFRNRPPELLEFINPEILEESSEQVYLDEGCLSLPGIIVNLSRPQEVMMKAFDRHGNEFIVVGHDIEAVTLKHELEHLNGESFIDKLSRKQRRIIEKKARL